MAKITLREGKSSTFAVTDGGIIRDWPLTTTASPVTYDFIRLFVVGGDVYVRTGIDGLAVGDVVTPTQDTDNHDNIFPANSISDEIERLELRIEHTKIGFRCKTGINATVTMTPE